MKSKILIASILFLTAFSFISCDGDVEPLDPAVLNPIDPNNPNNPNNPVQSFLKADFNGSTFNATTTQAFMGAGVMIISGTKANGEGFGLLIDGTVTGTYTGEEAMISYTKNATAEYDYSNLNENFEANGSIVITGIDTAAKTISGTFQFTGYYSDFSVPNPAMDFTNGSFTVSYTTSATTSDTFFAKVNGVEFSEDLIIVGVDEGPAQGNIISLNAIDANQNTIVLFFPNNLVINQAYNIDNSVTSVFRAEYHFDDVTYIGNGGSIIITNRTDSRVMGTFQITVYDAESDTGFTITEGSFDVEY